MSQGLPAPAAPPTYEQLQQMTQQLVQENQRLQQVVASRTIPMVGEFIDGLNYLTQMALSGNEGAKADLKKLSDLFDGGIQAAAGGIIKATGTVPAAPQQPSAAHRR